MKNYEQLIQPHFNNLMECSVQPLLEKDAKDIKRAFYVAHTQYAGITQADGSPYILHDLAVAIAAMKEIGLGPTSAICALLHSLPLKTAYKIEQIREDFGDNIADIVDGFHQISKLQTERISFCC